MGRILPRFDFRVELASDSVAGTVRAKNEDALLLAPELALFGVADGMGGLSSGEVASSLALDTARAFLTSRMSAKAFDAYQSSPTLERRREVFARLRGACEAAHAKLCEEQEARKLTMGTTLDLCLFIRDKAFIAHVGDGRLFLVRPLATLQITEDHLARDPSSNRNAEPRKLPRPLASGIGLPTPLRIDVLAVDLRKGDTLLMASDGAYGPLDSEAAVSTACRGAARAVADSIIKHSLAKGGRDNASLIVVRIDERLVARSSGERAEGDHMSLIQHCPVFVGLSAANLLAALSSAIEVEIEPGAEVPRFEAGDLCAYVVLEGVVKIGTTTLGPPALLFAESLVGVDKGGRAPLVVDRLRCLRIRRDDFREVAEHDPSLGRALYQRLAGHLARMQ